MRLPASICAGVAAAVIAGLLLAAVTHGLGVWQSWVALASGAVTAFLTWRSMKHDFRMLPGFWGCLILGVYVLASFRAFFWLFFPEGKQWMVLSPNNLGDLSLHIALIRNFASGVDFWPQNPIFAGVPLAYPPGSDFFNSLLLLAGLDLRGGLILCGFVFSVLGGWMLWRFGGAFCVAAFLLGGGLAGFAILRTGNFVDYTQEAIWKNPFLTMIITQRGFLFALPMALVLLTAWREEFFEEKKWTVPWSVQVLLYASLPVFQVHTFLFLSLCLAAAFFLKRCKDFRPVWLVLAALIPASVAMYFVTGGFSAGSAFRFQPFWAAPKGLVPFLLEFGLVILLCGVLVWRLVKTGVPASWWLAGTGVLVALGAFLFPLHPWAWDNTKVLVWSWILLAPVLWQYIFLPLPVVARSSLCGLLFFTGAISLPAGLDSRHGYHLASRQDLAAWQVAVQDIPPGTVFAAVPDYNQPLLLLGRNVVCGYDGHLYSHGIDYSSRLQLLKAVLSRGELTSDEAAYLRADYLALVSSSGEPVLIPAPLIRE